MHQCSNCRYPRWLHHRHRGHTTSGPYYIGHNRFMYQYVAESNKCVRKTVLPKWVDADSAVASCGERVVIVGGSNRPRVMCVRCY